MSRQTDVGQTSNTPRLRSRDRTVVSVTVLGLVALSGIVLAIAGETLPFDRPTFAGVPVWRQVVQGWFYLLGAALLMGVTYLVTRRRQVPDMAARAPARRRAAREAGFIVGYAAIAQAVGFFLGHAVGSYPISLHMPSVLFGVSHPPDPSWIFVWAGYNFIVYAALPYLYFRRSGYTNEQLNLRSSDRRADLKLILIILTIETTVELVVLGKGLFALGAGVATEAMTISFALNFVGTVLPIAVLIYAILLPRVLRVTGSTAATVVIGGLAYSLIHFFDGWTNYGSIRAAILSIIFLLMQYFGPGMVKTVLTLRTGNTWVHVWSYHAVAPHATIDAPSVVKPFHLH